MRERGTYLALDVHFDVDTPATVFLSLGTIESARLNDAKSFNQRSEDFKSSRSTDAKSMNPDVIQANPIASSLYGASLSIMSGES